jgi:hypothetical protein
MRRYFTTTKEVINKFKIYDYIFFDLDNTVYDEFNYIKKIIEKNYHNFNFSKLLTIKRFQQKLPYIYKKYGNNKLINKIYYFFNINKLYLKKDIEYAKNVKSNFKLKCFKWFLKYLNNSDNINNNYIVTNGKKWRQLEKIKLLNLNKFIKKNNLIFADQFPKPSIKSLKNFKKISSYRVLMIGDHKVDAIFSKKMNFDFYKINFKRNMDGFVNENTIFFSH